MGPQQQVPCFPVHLPKPVLFSANTCRILCTKTACRCLSPISDLAADTFTYTREVTIFLFQLREWLLGTVTKNANGGLQTPKIAQKLID